MVKSKDKKQGTVMRRNQNKPILTLAENYQRFFGIKLIPEGVNNTIKESFGVPGEDVYAQKAAREISIALNDIEAMGKDVPQEYIDILEDWEDQCEAMDILDIYYNFENVDQELLDLVPNMVRDFTKLYKKGVASGQIEENYKRFFGKNSLLLEKWDENVNESAEVDFDPEVETKIELSGQSHDFTYIQNPEDGEGYLFVDGNQVAHWSFDGGGTAGVMESPSVGDLLSWIADIMWATGNKEGANEF